MFDDYFCANAFKMVLRTRARAWAPTTRMYECAQRRIRAHAIAPRNALAVQFQQRICERMEWRKKNLAILRLATESDLRQETGSENYGKDVSSLRCKMRKTRWDRS